MHIPGYELRDRLGEGALSVVYRARRTSDESLVALKILTANPERNPKARERFLRAAHSGANLPPHPNVVRIQNVLETPRPLLVMDYIEGMTLRTLLEAAGSLPVAEAARIALDAARGLAHAHAHGIVHRDVKPDNILIRNDGQTLISDFGLAKIATEGSGPRLTQTGHAVGTPVYMAPEQAVNAKSVEATSDVYSLGATLFHLLAGTPPFTGAGAGEILVQVLEGDHLDLARLEPDIPPGLTRLVERMIERDPARRPETVDEVVRALAPFTN